MPSRIIWLVGLVLVLIAVGYLPSGSDLWIYAAAGGAMAVIGSVKSQRSTPWCAGYVLIGIGIATLGIGHLAGLPSNLELPVAGGLIAVGWVLVARHAGQPSVNGQQRAGADTRLEELMNARRLGAGR